MLTYRARRRIFRLDNDASIAFPAEAVVRFHFQPPAAFGSSADGGRAIVRGAAARVIFDSNTGRGSVMSSAPLQPLDVEIVAPDIRFDLKGQVLSISQRVESTDELEGVIESNYFVLPMLLSLHFADPPIVERVEGSIGARLFRWELREWKFHFGVTDQDHQEKSVVLAWDRVVVVAARERRRLLAAIAYFHTAVRLLDVSHTPGEFLAESILNFSKVLEVLFPGPPQQTISSARAGLAQLGYSENDQDDLFIPAIALRNRIGVGHVDLTIFTSAQLESIHEYCEHASTSFRELLNRMFDRIADGSYDVAPGEASHPEPEDLRIIGRLDAARARRAV